MSEIMVTQDGGVLEVVLNRPKKKNALTFAMYDALVDALRTAHENPQGRVMTLSAAGDSFCAENDINDFLSNVTIDPASSPPVRFIEALVRLESFSSSRCKVPRSGLA
jgi:enoyl-CoA hydratase/carnithine racemase